MRSSRQWDRFAEYMRGYCSIPEHFRSMDSETLQNYIDAQMSLCEGLEYRDKFNEGRLDALIDIADDNGWGMD